MTVRTRSHSLIDYYLASILIGLKSLPSRYVRDAAARIVNPLSYPRYLEYRLVFEQLELVNGCKVLDIGSPKLPMLLLARDTQCELHATDIRNYFINSMTHFLKSMGLSHRLGRDIYLSTRDARNLFYDDAAFDRIFSISVLEHIPDDGDVQAMREIARVLRPGGIVALTVPFCAKGLQNEYVKGAVFERREDEGPTFYQRRYDLPALYSRLIGPSGLTLVDSTFFGEPGIHFEKYWNRVSMRWKLPILWAQPFLAQIFLKRLGSNRLDAACGVALKLMKPDETSEIATQNVGLAVGP